MIWKRPFEIGDRVVYDCPHRRVPMRGEVQRVLMFNVCIVYFPASGASLELSPVLLRHCPYLVSCRPSDVRRGGAA